MKKLVFLFVVSIFILTFFSLSEYIIANGCVEDIDCCDMYPDYRVRCVDGSCIIIVDFEEESEEGYYCPDRPSTDFTECTLGECDNTNRKYCLDDGTWSAVDSAEYIDNCLCGDGECAGGETPVSCPEDCSCVNPSDCPSQDSDIDEDHPDGINYEVAGKCTNYECRSGKCEIINQGPDNCVSSSSPSIREYYIREESCANIYKDCRVYCAGQYSGYTGSCEEDYDGMDYCDCTGGPEPDLTISDVWYDPATKRIHYTIKNRGGGSAGYSITKLYVDGDLESQDVVALLGAGNSIDREFNYEWECSGDFDAIEVCADVPNSGYTPIEESDEDNNCMFKTFPCENTIMLYKGQNVLGAPEMTLQDFNCEFSYFVDEDGKAISLSSAPFFYFDANEQIFVGPTSSFRKTRNGLAYFIPVKSNRCTLEYDPEKRVDSITLYKGQNVIAIPYTLTARIIKRICGDSFLSFFENPDTHERISTTTNPFVYFDTKEDHVMATYEFEKTDTIEPYIGYWIPVSLNAVRSHCTIEFDENGEAIIL